jgi:hypothetical protein
MAFWTEVAFCAAGAVVQGLLYAQHAALAQGVAVLNVVHVVLVSIWFNLHRKARFWELSHCTAMLVRALKVAAVGLHVAVLWKTAAVLWTRFFWTSTIVFGLPILTTTPFLHDMYWHVMKPWVPLMCQPVQFGRKMVDGFDPEPFAILVRIALLSAWLVNTIVMPVVQVYFPAGPTVWALWCWADDASVRRAKQGGLQNRSA